MSAMIFTPDDDFATPTEPTDAPPGPPEPVVPLRHLYGSSYFGSGGVSGVVDVRNAERVGSRDNGFVAGPDAVRVIDPSKPAAYLALGSALGMGLRDGPQTWAESGIWRPGVGWMRGDGERHIDSREQRRAWLDAAVAEVAP